VRYTALVIGVAAWALWQCGGIVERGAGPEYGSDAGGSSPEAEPPPVTRDAQPEIDVVLIPDVVVPDAVPPSSCGDAVVDPGEACDDGNRVDGDGCTATCTAIEPPWHCVFPGAPCQLCGDGVRESAEICDDGNTEGGDGCAADCMEVEWGFNCGEPGTRCVICGDGVLRDPEVCDDGNRTSGDGCRFDCAAIEPGWECTVPGVPCADGCQDDCTREYCGNGWAETGEECDDGNNLPLDGCSPYCQFEGML
jgi:cysteine-rich repeat protein